MGKTENSLQFYGISELAEPNEVKSLPILMLLN